MKQGIHPQFHSNAVISCSCGAQMQTGSTQTALTTEICSTCHPFYTGQQNLVDTAGRVERFKTRQARSSALTKPPKKERKSRATAK